MCKKLRGLCIPSKGRKNRIKLWLMSATPGAGTSEKTAQIEEINPGTEHPMRRGRGWLKNGKLAGNLGTPGISLLIAEPSFVIWHLEQIPPTGGPGLQTIPIRD